MMAFNAEKRQMDQAAIDAEREEDLKYLEVRRRAESRIGMLVPGANHGGMPPAPSGTQPETRRAHPRAAWHWREGHARLARPRSATDL